MKKLLFILACSVMMFACGDALQQQIEVAAQLVNNSCPQKLNEQITLTSVQAKPGLILEYSATLNNVLAKDLNLSENTMLQLKQQMLDALKFDQQAYKMIQNGVSYKYKYYDTTGQFAYEVTICQDDLKNIGN
ncbi:MAG: hypothetical protein IJW42_07615 [Alistipes sp.]|nr:hypothetical protein [Alistipes sp.]MBQ7343104.1 hypothetical protein [Alistipes sp.]